MPYSTILWTMPSGVTSSRSPGISALTMTRTSFNDSTAKALRLGLRSTSVVEVHPGYCLFRGIIHIFDCGRTGTGNTRLVPTSSGEWNGHMIFTCGLEGLHGFPEYIGTLREQNSKHGHIRAVGSASAGILIGSEL